MPPGSPPSSDRPAVFLSYSHQDEPWKDRVVTHLKILQGELEIWNDRDIAGGDDWLSKIREAMDRAVVAVLLVSPDFLASKFIQETEAPHLLKRLNPR